MGLGRVGVVVGEAAVDLAQKTLVAAGEAGGSASMTGPAAPLPASQTTLERPGRRGVLEQAGDVGLEQVDRAVTLTVALREVALGGEAAELWMSAPKKGAVPSISLKPL